MLLSIFVWLSLALTGHAQILSFTPSSCLDPDSAGSAAELLQFDTAYAQFDQGQTAAGQLGSGIDLGQLGLYSDNSTELSGTGAMLRLVLTGTTQAESDGYSNVTTFLSTMSEDTDFLTFPVSSNKSALCNAIRTEGVNGLGCPYGPGTIAMGVQIPLHNSFQFTTLSTQVVVLDSSVPALTLACYDLAVTPYYPSFVAYPLLRWFVVGLLATYLLLYAVARLWASQTNWRHDNETFLATSLTLKLSTAETALSRRQRWSSIWFSAWAGRQVVGSGSLRRFLTSESREVFTTVAWFSLIGTVAVEWPGFACEWRCGRGEGGLADR